MQSVVCAGRFLDACCSYELCVRCESEMQSYSGSHGFSIWKAQTTGSVLTAAEVAAKWGK